LEALIQQLKPEGEGVIPSKYDWEKSRAGLEEVFRLKAFRHLEEPRKSPL